MYNYTLKQEKDIIEKFNSRFKEGQERVGPDTLSLMYQEIMEDRRTRKKQRKRITFLIFSGVVLTTLLYIERYWAVVTYIVGIVAGIYTKNKIKEAIR